MIQVYDKNTTIEGFERNGRVLNDILSCYIVEELNGQYTLELEHPKDERGKYLELQPWSVIKAGEDGQLFRIPTQENIQEDAIKVKVTGSHIFYDLNNCFILDRRAENKTAQEALKIALEVNPKYKVVECDVAGTNTAYFVKDNLIKAVFTILERWGGELYRSNFNVGIKKSIGRDTGILVSFSKNILGFKQTINIADVVNEMMPTGKDGITIAAVNGGSKYLVSPRVNDYPFPITKEVKFENAETPQQLLTEALKLWGVIDVPKVTYDIKFADLAKTKEYERFKDLLKLKVGDIVIVRHEIFNVDIAAKVIRTKKNVLTDKLEEITLEDYKDNFIDTTNKIESSVATVSEDLNKAKISFKETTDGLQVEVSKKIDGEEAKTIISQSATEIRAAVSNTNFVFEEEGFKVKHIDGSYTQIKPDGLKRFVGSYSKEYHYLMYNGTAWGVQNGTVTIQLPQEFKNKDFTVTVSVASTYSTEFGAGVTNFECFVQSIDKPNARATIKTQSFFYNVVQGKAADQSQVKIEFSYTAIA